MGKRKKNKKINKEEICDDFCFRCKEGGSLRICDYGDYLKAYHPKCVGEDDSFLESEVPWTCSWHFCFNCNNTPKFHCFCCPNAICGLCFRDFEFAVIGRKGGLCNHCCMLSGVIEGVENPDPDLEKIDFDDPETYESFFKDYWEIIKQKERLTSVHVRDAVEQLHKCRISKDFTDLSGDEYRPKSSNDHSNVRKGHKAMNKRKRNGENMSAMRRKLYSKKKEFNGWASNLLSDFLESIGKDTTETLSEHDISSIVIEYCHENKLFDPEKKKKVVCDERLKSLLGKNSVCKNSIHKLLAPHFAENVEQSEDEHERSDDDHENVFEDKSESAPVSSKRQRNSSSNVKPRKNEAIDLVVRHRGYFASVVAENIRRLYLNRSLIEELAQKPETFEDKVIGSFVRIKSDPYDYMQKNSHMLVKVTGIKRISRKDEATKDVLLQVSCMPPKDISIRLLSNDNFSEEECDDLRQRVKDGRFERLSIVKFEEKVRSLHEVITKQWIVKELYRLDKLIDQANQKGWRRELHSYIERKQLLATPSEQSRLLHEFREVIAEETELDPTEMQYSRKDLLSESDSRNLSKPSTKNSGGDCVIPCINDVADFTEHERQCEGPKSEGLEQQHHTVSPDESNDDSGIHEAVVNERVIIEVEKNDPQASRSQRVSGNRIGIPQAQLNSVLSERLKKKQNGPISKLIEMCNDEKDTPKKKQNGPISELIEICDDDEQDNTVQMKKEAIEISDDEEQHNTTGVSKKIVDDPNSCSWYYMSPLCLKAGPYSMSMLKEWNDAFPNELTLKVWNTTQSPKEAISVADAVRQFSGGK